MPLITRSEAARALGVTPEAVYAAVKTGRLPVVRTADGRELVNSETMREHWAKNTQRRIGRGPKPAAGQKAFPAARPRMAKTEESIPDYDESRARTEHLKAELLELDRKQKEGVLVKAEEVELKWVGDCDASEDKNFRDTNKSKAKDPGSRHRCGVNAGRYCSRNPGRFVGERRR
jgi:hypothetical protein